VSNGPTQETALTERGIAGLKGGDPTPDRSPWLHVVVPFALAYALSQFVRSANAVIAPELTVEFELSASDLGFLTSMYFVAFAAAQLPVGLLLDRYGSRAVETVFLLMLGAGCALFALSSNVASLGGSRAMIGLGGSACLMAAFKAIVERFESRDRAPLNSIVLAIGGIGSIAATVPLAALLSLVGWRGALLIVAAASIGGAAALFMMTPDSAPGRAGTTSLRDAFRGTLAVLRSRRFWRFAPQMMIGSGGFMAIQSLWAVPWMMQVNLMPRSEAAGVLLAMGVAVIVGHLSNASVAAWLARRHLSPFRLLAWGGAATLGCELLILADMGPRLLLWSMYGLAFSTLSMSYPILTSEFPAELAGRLNTALNLAVFAGGFAIQWSFGLVVDAVARLGYPDDVGLRVAYTAWVTLQAASFVWLLVPYRRSGCLAR